MRDDIFVFTEAYNCGKVLNPSLESFHKYHDQTVHIFGTRDDFDELNPDTRNHPNNRFIDLTNDATLKSLYTQGHAGTSYIFAKVFSNHYGIAKVIHFDSDNVFRKESLSLITQAFDEGFDVVGPRRCYRYNRNNRDDIRHQPDTVHTSFFGMKINVLTKIGFSCHVKEFPKVTLSLYGTWMKSKFRKMCEGSYCPFKYFKILDFFDPVTYDALINGAKFFFLDHDLVGGFDEFGSIDNVYPGINVIEYDIGENLVHFAGVGSGYSIHRGKSSPVPSYADWALGRYAFYAKLFFDEDIGYEYNVELYKKTKEILGMR